MKGSSPAMMAPRKKQTFRPVSAAHSNRVKARRCVIGTSMGALLVLSLSAWTGGIGDQLLQLTTRDEQIPTQAHHAQPLILDEVTNRWLWLPGFFGDFANAE